MPNSSGEFHKEENLIISYAEELLQKGVFTFEIQEIYVRCEQREVWCVLKCDYVNLDILEEFYSKTYEIAEEIFFFVDGTKEIDVDRIPSYDRKLRNVA